MVLCYKSYKMTCFGCIKNPPSLQGSLRPGTERVQQSMFSSRVTDLYYIYKKLLLLIHVCLIEVFIYHYFMLSGRISRNIGENIFRYFMLSGRISRNIGENIFRYFMLSDRISRNIGENIFRYFMLSGRRSRNISENIFRSYTGTTSVNTDFHVLVA